MAVPATYTMVSAGKTGYFHQRTERLEDQFYRKPDDGTRCPTWTTFDVDNGKRKGGDRTGSGPKFTGYGNDLVDVDEARLL